MVDTIQTLGKKNVDEVTAFLGCQRWQRIGFDDATGVWTFLTSDGPMDANPGDYILKYANDHPFYPIPKQVYEDTLEQERDEDWRDRNV